MDSTTNLSEDKVRTILTIYDNGYQNEAAVTELLNRTYESSIAEETVRSELIKQRRILVEKKNGMTITSYLRRSSVGTEDA